MDEPALQQTERKFDLEERLLKFAAMIIRVVDGMRRTPAGRHVGGQLLGCGTNPMSSHAEAQGAESVRDFIHKFRVGLKELRESSRWLKLTILSDLNQDQDFVRRVLNETDQLTRIFNASIQTAKKRLQKDI
ncbi:MAG: four helix bundle protein [Gemmataceae bacterium]|nr:four helix bundle protein [Gemmataceae bacterium]MCI0742463.1 four helix bundle protein [Gemmataceae bacterium]